MAEEDINHIIMTSFKIHCIFYHTENIAHQVINVLTAVQEGKWSNSTHIYVLCVSYLCKILECLFFLLDGIRLFLKKNILGKGYYEEHYRLLNPLKVDIQAMLIALNVLKEKSTKLFLNTTVARTIVIFCRSFRKDKYGHPT